MDSNDKIWYAVVNPNAGSGKTVSEWPRASKILSDNRIDFEYKTTWKMGAAVEITMKACAEGYRKFLAVGGDGTVHEVLEGIAKYVRISAVAKTLDKESQKVALDDFTLAVMPIGSGNDWIKTLEIPKDFNKVAELMKRESTGRQDVFCLSLRDNNTSRNLESFMANVGGVGFDANVCKKVNFEKNTGKSGKVLYLKALISNILNFKTFDCVVEADGKEIQRNDYVHSPWSREIFRRRYAPGAGCSSGRRSSGHYHNTSDAPAPHNQGSSGTVHRQTSEGQSGTHFRKVQQLEHQTFILPSPAGGSGRRGGGQFAGEHRTPGRAAESSQKFVEKPRRASKAGALRTSGGINA